VGPTPVNFNYNVGRQAVGGEGWVASYSAEPASGTRQLLLVEVVRLTGPPAGSIDLKDAFPSFLNSLNSSLAQGGLAAREAAVDFRVGEDSRGFALSGRGGLYSGGAGVLFRRGAVLAVVMLASRPALASNETLVALAQQQDAKLQSVPPQPVVREIGSRFR